MLLQPKKHPKWCKIVIFAPLWIVYICIRLLTDYAARRQQTGPGARPFRPVRPARWTIMQIVMGRTEFHFVLAAIRAPECISPTSLLNSSFLCIGGYLFREYLLIYASRSRQNYHYLANRQGRLGQAIFVSEKWRKFAIGRKNERTDQDCQLSTKNMDF